MLESDLSEAIAKHCADRGWFWVRFEVAVQPGVPDGFIGAGRGLHAWVELKSTRGAERPVYRPGQLGWASRAVNRGERCVTLASGADGLLRLYDTDAVAQAVAFSRAFPPPMLTTHDLAEALCAALGPHQPAGVVDPLLDSRVA